MTDAVTLDTTQERRTEFTALLANHQGIIQKVARLYTDDPEERRDLAQEICLQMWRGYPSFDHRAKLSTWMYAVALNTALTHMRRKRRRPRLDPLEAAHGLADPAPVPDAPEVARRRALHAALRRLDPGERALALLWLEENSYDEIAMVTGLSPSHVGVKLHRLRGRLKAMLAEGEDAAERRNV